MVKAKTPARQAVRSAALYARISADADGKSLGVQRQLEDCRKLAADRGWPVGAEDVDNDVSVTAKRDLFYRAIRSLSRFDEIAPGGENRCLSVQFRLKQFKMS